MVCYGAAMPSRNVRNIYVSDADLRVWDELEAVAQRRGVSLAKQVTGLVRDYVEQTYSGRDLGLPVGFRIPESMKDPRVVKAEQTADDIRESALKAMLDNIKESS